jgi:hypothetical protein
MSDDEARGLRDDHAKALTDGASTPAVRTVRGSVAESNLLGALILRPDMLRVAQNLVSEIDFQDARLGRAWSGIADMIGRKMIVDPITVQNRFEEWGLSGMENEVFLWASAEVYPFAIDEYAMAGREFTQQEPALDPVTSMPYADGRLAPTMQPSDVASSMHRRIGEVLDRHASTDDEVVSLRQVLLGVDNYDWIIPGILERMDRLIVTGPEGAGKTTWCRQMVVLAAAGINPITFEPNMDPARVLVVDAENTEKQWRRGVRWMATQAAREGKADPQDRIFIKAGHRIDITRGTELAKIHRYIDEFNPDIVYIGPLYKMVPGAITNDDDAAPLIMALDSIRERNVALIMEAHAGKATDPGGNRNLAPRGSSALLGWPEFGLGLRPSEDIPGLVDIIRWRGDRDERNFPTSMTRGGPLWPWSPASY